MIFGRKQERAADAEQKALLRHQYEEVCRSYHAIDDFRAKLLAVLPIGGGAVGIGLILGKTPQPEYLLPLAPSAS
jgi:hypothetical protein